MKPSAEVDTPWYCSTLSIGLVGSLLFWAALPPLALGWLAWIAPVPWLLLIRADRLSGRRPYRALWLAGFVFWLMAIHWLRLPHPAVYLGWLALSAYLAFYLPVFVGLSRVAVHQLRVPLWLAAPTVWTGLELARAHLLTGFLMGSLAHTQVGWTRLIQISDLAGEYGVDFLVMLVAACVTNAFRLRIAAPRGYPELRIGLNNPQSAIRNPKWIFRPLALVPAIIALAVTLTYGHWRLGEAQSASLGSQSQPSGPRIALIQGNSLAEWKYDPSRERQIMDEYAALSEQAVTVAKERGDGRPIDLIVWPETMFRTSLVTFDAGYRLPPGVSETPEKIAAYGPRDLAILVRRLGTAILVGVDRAHFPVLSSQDGKSSPPRRYNSAVLVNRAGDMVGTYDKVHRVMFGEYIPFANWLPSLYRLTPLTGGIEAGADPVALELDNVVYAPNICYETAIPHVIRRQVASLTARNTPPDVMVNVTNDAWYWGSSELDMHLACGVFRAVEARRPLVIAANGGISAWIDHLGRVRAKSPRRHADVIVADVELSNLRSAYVELGDWFAGGCLAFSGIMAVVGWRSLTQTRRQGDS
jgi:apolipoprotein N-acyltransferase